MKHKAPAVHQAIEIMEQLAQANPLTLGEIAEKTGFSKATILRLLDTLEEHNWIKKLKTEKSYIPTVTIRPTEETTENIEEQIQSVLDNLCANTNHTVEWYKINNKYGEITQRSEPSGRIVNIKAQLGFRRIFSSELEAVARIAMVHNQADCKGNEPKAGYTIYKAGKLIHISLDKAEKIIKATPKTKATYDKEWNSNGIRRHAVGVKQPDKNLAGILSIATAFTPQADSKIKSINTALENAALKLEKIFKSYYTNP